MSVIEDDPLAEPDEPATTDQQIGTIVQMLLTSKGWYAKNLSGLIGVSRSNAAERLSGNRSFRPDELKKIADTFEVSPAIFFEDPKTLLKRWSPDPERAPNGASATGRSQKSCSTESAGRSMSPTPMRPHPTPGTRCESHARKRPGNQPMNSRRR